MLRCCWSSARSRSTVTAWRARSHSYLPGWQPPRDCVSLVQRWASFGILLGIKHAVRHTQMNTVVLAVCPEECLMTIKTCRYTPELQDIHYSEYYYTAVPLQV